MRVFSADVQIHSCLSPCGSLDNSPRRIVAEAEKKNIDIIALTDHNTTANCPAFAAAVKAADKITAFYGTEVTSEEEVHVICLFETPKCAIAFGNYISSHLAPGKNKPDFFGDQPVVDAEENIIRLEDALLAGATFLSIDTIVKQAHQHEGIAIASHIDRNTQSIFSQLGIWPEGVPFDACDVSKHGNADNFRDRVPENIPFIRSSDAHYLEDIGSVCTYMRMEAPTFPEFKKALLFEEGRGVFLETPRN